ncbi:hypothetical protein BCR41DRAFT_360836 [Lobosporangium transversale]|uniref:SMP-LTD domain-containing protein n=1 Tax=Lobosporangium transversale TaxID=64571 RepID=A0A1Y2GDN8_9FUNG|nr:hypothetical protein BCR41DRAFT_360836 [Lobosporangium transversale]ORZ06547.1 hypothetical protein BCR41DRAFT_360836 [Lobosporangium transversale]|eukprot:XP_021877590.1 hypothetical protein BCR41DRAFT_360836 [Lobosporangium transversale]
MQADPNLNREGYVRMTRVPRLGPAAESISDYMTNMLFQPKNARPKDSYYAVLRYDTLFLYESDQQRDCKAVVPMTLYEVRIFPKNLPDNECFNKEHPIQIKRKIDAPTSAIAMDNDQDEFYIFVHTPVVKEDWFLALLYASKLRKPGTKQKIRDKAHFDPEAIQNHIRILHSDKHHEHTRWFNSFLGRIFLGVYKTKRIREIFIQKITRKTRKLKRPSFLGEIKVRSFDIGHSIPYITRTKLHELSMTGELSAEFHLAYRGGIRVEIEVDVGLGLATLKPVKVTVVLAVLVKAISGMMTLKIKAPPTNRFWIGFQEPPELEIVIEPIVADKAIKLNMVLSAIETKIREAMVEAIVLPNMDDYPFFDSHGTGGIFEGDEEVSTEVADDSDADSSTTEKIRKAEKPGESASSTPIRSKRRGSESSFDSEQAPPGPQSLISERKPSWSSTGTESDMDLETVPITSTPLPTMYIHQQHNTSSSNASTISTSSFASKFKRFSQAHFSSKSQDPVADPSKLNTKPTVATSIATAIRTSPSTTPQSSSSTTSSGSKLQSAIPKLSALNDVAEAQGSRLSVSSPSNGPSKKSSTSSLRLLANLESTVSNDDADSDTNNGTVSSAVNDVLYQSLQSLAESSSKRDSPDSSSRPGQETLPKSTNMMRWSTASPHTDEDKGKDAEEDSPKNDLNVSSSLVGIAGILEKNSSRSGGSTVSSSSISQIQGNHANMLTADKKSKKGQSKGDESPQSNADSNNNSSNENTEQVSSKRNTGESGKDSKDRGRDHGRRSSGDSLLNLKSKKDSLLKKITSRNNDEDQGSKGSNSGGGSDNNSIKGTSPKFSLDSVGTLLGNRRKGSVSSGRGPLPLSTAPSHEAAVIQELQEQENDLGSRQYNLYRRHESSPRPGLTRSISSASTSNVGIGARASPRREVDLYPLGRPFENTTANIDTPTPTTTQPASSSITSKSAYLQQKSQAALGSAKAWVKRSLEDRRMSEDDPLLSGKMHLD